MSLLCLLPGAVSATPASEDLCLPLGSILVTQATHWTAEFDLPQLAKVREASPWAPLAVITDSARPDSLVGLLPLVLGEVAEVRVRPNGREPLVEEVRCGVMARGAPTQSEFVSYFRLRLGPAMAQQISDALDSDGRRSLRGSLQRARLMPPSDWRGLYRLVAALGESWAGRYGQAQAAAAIGTTVPTLSRGCRHYVGMSWRLLRDVCVWEAICECALLHHAEVASYGNLSRTVVRGPDVISNGPASHRTFPKQHLS